MSVLLLTKKIYLISDFHIMRNLFFIAVLFIIAQQSFAQDKIVKLNGETINCKITEIGVSTIKYKGDGEDSG